MTGFYIFLLIVIVCFVACGVCLYNYIVMYNRASDKYVELYDRMREQKSATHRIHVQYVVTESDLTQFRDENKLKKHARKHLAGAIASQIMSEFNELHAETGSDGRTRYTLTLYVRSKYGNPA